MKIAMIGTGYVGLVSGACFSEFGFEVTCVDQDPDKIARLQKGEIHIYEPGLPEVVKRNVQAERLFFTTDLASAVAEADAVFIAVGTPSRRGDGNADLTYVFRAAEQIAQSLDGYTLVVTKSTVPVGTGEKVAEVIRRTRPDAEFDVASNPEFLREGSAIDDFMRPDRVLVGAENPRAVECLQRIYRPLNLNDAQVMVTDIRTAELAKYASNCFLAVKVAFINQMADLCEQVKANVEDLARCMGLDQRIGNRFLQPGPGYGGSCFPKDTLALAHTAQEAAAPATIVEAAISANDARKEKMAQRVVEAVGGTVRGKILTILGLAFKPDTDDMRESPALTIVEKLLEQDAYLKVYDPKAMEEARKIIGDRVEYCENAYDAMFESEAVVIVTEWNEFRSLDLTKVRNLLKQPLILDFRNIYKPKDLEQAGFDYRSVGRRSTRVKAVA